MKFVYLLLLFGLVTALISFTNTLSKSKAELYRINERIFAGLAKIKRKGILVVVVVVMCILTILILRASLYPFF